jgi:hypothetical protein
MSVIFHACQAIEAETKRTYSIFALIALVQKRRLLSQHFCLLESILL